MDGSPIEPVEIDVNNLLHDIAAALRAGMNEWKRCRWLRRFGNPDICPF